MLLSIILTVSFSILHYCRRQTFVDHSSGRQEPPLIPFKPSTNLKGSLQRFIISSLLSQISFLRITEAFINELNNTYAYIDNYISYVVKNVNDSAIANQAKAKEYLEIGNVFAGQDDYERALENYNSAIRLDQNFVDAFYYRSIAYIIQSDLDHAIEDLNHVINHRPDVPNYYFTRAKLYIDKKNYTCVIDDCTKAIELNPNCVTDYYYYRGIAYKNIGDNDRAIEDFSFVIRLDPNPVEALKQRSCIYAEIGKDDLAIRDFVQELKLRFQ